MTRAVTAADSAIPILGLRYEEIGAVARLGRSCRDRAAARDALVRRQFGALLDLNRQQVKGALGMLLDQLELRERRRRILVGLDVVAVLHLVEPVLRALMLVIARMILPG